VISVFGGAGVATYAMRVLPGVGGIASFEQQLAIAALPLWIGAMAVAGAYRSAYFNAGSDAVRRFFVGTVGGVLALTFLAFVLDLPISRLFVGILAAVALTLGTIARAGFRLILLRAYRAGRLIERTLIVGHDAYAVDLASLLTDGSGVPYRAVGLLWTGDNGQDLPRTLGIPVLQSHESVSEVCRDLGVDVVLVASGGLSPEAMRDLFIQLEGTEQRVIVAPSLFPLLPWRMAIETITGLPLVHVAEAHLSGMRGAAKRTMDVVGSILLLVVLSPLLMAAMLAVLVTDGRPVLFHQTRVGRDGRPFTLRKVRTMVRDAEAQLESLQHRNESDGHFFKLSDDPRVTCLGRALRRSSIDEIPQLWSVLKGDMSLVGPRPLFSQPEEYGEVERRRLRIRPGLTGAWQISGRSSVNGSEAIQKDLFYLENWTVLGDIIILARTIPAVFGRKGAA
jgi:exopolysaccharide biosynthesis polyprenyl glycosylphosphotransferase